jgi:hypothetical protein
MAKTLQADIRIVEGAGILEPGSGYVNQDGFSAKAGGLLRWADISEMRKLDTRAGNAAAGALAAGGLGLIGGPPVAAMAAAGGALAATIAGAKELWAVRTAFGSDILIEIGAWRSRAMQSQFGSLASKQSAGKVAQIQQKFLSKIKRE